MLDLPVEILSKVDSSRGYFVWAAYEKVMVASAKLIGRGSASLKIMGDWGSSTYPSLCRPFACVGFGLSDVFIISLGWDLEILVAQATMSFLRLPQLSPL